MTTTNTMAHRISVLRIEPPATPRGAVWIGLLIDAVQRLLAAAAPPARQPRTALEQAIAEAAEVRELARQVWRHQPGFAADLVAAADRHERLAEQAQRR